MSSDEQAEHQPPPARGRVRRWIWGALFALIAVGLGGWAYHVYPREHPPSLVGQTNIVLKLPKGAQSGYVALAQLVTKTNGQTTTRVSIEVDFTKAVPGSDVTVTMAYPPIATLRRCADTTSDPGESDQPLTPIVSCHNDGPTNVDIGAEVSVVTRVVSKDPKHQTKHPYVNISWSFTGNPGIDVAVGDGQILAALPRIVGQSKSTQTSIWYLLNSDETFNWLGRAPDFYNEGGYNVWIESYAKSSGPPIQVQGIDSAHRAMQDRKTFLAGVLAGLAGAAAIGLLQHLYVWRVEVRGS